MLKRIPDELLLYILGFLGYSDVLTGVACTSLSTHIPVEYYKSLIRALDLHWSTTTDATLLSMPVLPGLESMKLHKCNITDMGLSKVCNFFHIQSLDLSRCNNITDAGICHLLDVPRLQQLNLRGCKKITNKSMLTLAMLPDIQELDLACCNKITDEGIRNLDCLANLKYLNLSACNNITDAYVRELRQVHRDIYIEHF